MSITRQLTRRLTPPILADYFCRPSTNDAHTWSGIYPDFESVPQEGDGFDGESWLVPVANATAAAISDLGSPPSLPSDVPTFRAMLGLVISLIEHSTNNTIRILDFGGGMGAAFANLISMLPHLNSFSHLVVDNPESCLRGATLFDGDHRIQFASTLPHDLSGFDMCFLGSVLQYINDYRGLLAQLATGRPNYFLLGFTPIGEIPTFATAQKNVPGSSIPTWFFNIDELTHEFHHLGYELLFRSAFCERTFDMTNFPETHRLSHMSNLLFGVRRA